MLDFAASRAPTPDPAQTPVLDAIGVRQMAAASLEADGEARRGPFRPGVWLNARQRHTVRLAAYYFRGIDALCLTAVTLVCAWSVTPGDLAEAMVATVAPFAVGLAVVLGLLRSLSLYRFGRGEGGIVHLARLTAVVLTGGIAVAASGGLLAGADAPWTGYAVWTGVMVLALYGLHIGWGEIVARWRRTGALTPNVVIVGATRHAEGLIREALERRDVNILGVFDDRLSRTPRAIEGVPVLGRADALLNHRMTPFVDRIVLAIDPKAEGRVRELTARLSVLPNELSLIVDPQNETERAQALDKLARAPLAPLDGADDDRRAFNKRVQDMVVGSVALVLLAPVLAVTAALVRMDSPGPILFRQRRHGFNQEEIVVWKFRTMRHETADATASRQVTHNDDRVTRIGRLLRATSLDELPQLINVLSGEMSLVGPRPHAIGMKTGQIESSRLVAEYAHRHRIKPGMTGWAAIQGSRGPLHTPQDVRRRVQLDIDYVERQSFWLDLWIMAVTVPVLLGDRAAIR